MESTTSLQKVKFLLQDARCDAAGQEPRRFIPEGSLKEVLLSEDVLRALEDPKFGIAQHKLKATATTVMREALKVFAILVDLNLESYLAKFIEHDVLDSSLPVSKDRLEEIVPEAASSFEQLQWEYRAYRIRRNLQYRIQIRKSNVMPYTEQVVIGSGSYSTVYRVDIHPAHQDLAPKCQRSVTVVRKELRPMASNVEEQTDREAELLFLLGSLRHDNIIELLASYAYDGITNLIFPLADSDLHTFLLQSDRPAGFEEDHAILRAVHGLSSGLLHLHYFPSRPEKADGMPTASMIGYHHDIKPRNVLLRNSTFLLADFGLSRLRLESDGSQTKWKDTTFEYGAPECRDLKTFAAGTVGRALDIWSLGCVTSEVGTYIQLGAEGIRRFREKRLIEQQYGSVRCFHDGESLSSNVVEWFDYLESQTTSSALSKLVAFLPRALRGKANDRLDAKEFEEEMSCMAIEALFEAVIEAIKHYTHDEDTPHRNVYQTRLRLERARLIAWASVLGLVPAQGRLRPRDGQIRAFFSMFSTNLQVALEELKSPERFDNIKDNRDFILNTLYRLNNDLCNDLSSNTRASIDNCFAVLSTSDSDDLPLRTVENATLGDYAPRFKTVGDIAAMKHMSILMAKDELKSVQETRIEQSLIREDANKDKPELRPQTYWYSYGYREGEEERVLVEWKGYGIHLKGDFQSDEFKKIGEALFKRVQEMVVMLQHQPKPPEFRVLDCIGTFHDIGKQAFGIVYRYPSKTVVSVKLNALLRHGRRQAVFPDLNQKLALGQALVLSVHSFHISGWVHKNISPHSVLFFPQTVEGWKGLDLEKPYIVGFHHSRKDSVGEYTNGLTAEDVSKEYQHPWYVRGRTAYRRQYDYYSLGLLLLEIGMWASLSQIYERFPTHSPEQLVSEYIRFCKSDLKRSMGTKYALATIRCLESGKDDEVLSGPFDFQQEVVEELQSCSF